MRLAPILEYHTPASVEECVELLQAGGEKALVLAGGQSALQLLKSRHYRPEVLVDLSRVEGLSVRPPESSNGEASLIGAMVRYRTILESATIRSRWPALTDAAATIGDLQVRNRGTLGGNLAFADMASDLPPVVMCLGAEVVVAGRSGERSIPSADFFMGNRRTALQPAELIKAVRVPNDDHSSGSAYVKYGITANGRPVIGVAAHVTLDARGTCTGARIVVGGLPAGPVRATAAGEMLHGHEGGPEGLREAAERAAEDVPTHTDHRASAEYRKQLIRVYAPRAMQSALARAQEGLGR